MEGDTPVNILALEASTSSAKAIIYSTEKGVVYTVSESYKESVSDVVSLDPDGVYQTIINCARSILEKTNYTVEAIGLSSTWHSMLLLDKNRDPEGKIMTWADTETASTAGKYRQDEDLKYKIYQKTGCMIHSLYPLWKWIHLLKMGQVNSETYISSLPEYIFEKMTGEIGVSQSVASGTGFMNIHTLEWDEEILQFAKIKPKQLAPLRDPEYSAPLLKEEAEKLGLSSGIPVIITGPDGALNQIGSGALGEGIMTMSVGTSGAIRIAYDQPVLSKDFYTWCYYAAEGKRLAGAAISGAGNCLEWFKEKVQYNLIDYSLLDQLIQDLDIKDAPIFLPFLYGERCPGWQDSRSGGYYGLQGNHNTGLLYYAILEGILFNLYQSYLALIQVGDVPKEIRISGGIKNSSYWLQMAADIFQKEVHTSKIEHASTIGAVVMALKVMGEIDNLQDYKPDIGKKIIPDPQKVSLYQRRFDNYMDYYQKTI
jgi:gluconokinase